MTPAQASGHPNFVTDWPVQGPTDPGIRAADCRYAQKLPTPQNAPCVDCEGPTPMWTQSKGLLGERISYGGRGAVGFALAAAGDPDVWTQLTPDQQTWVMQTLTKLNDMIVKTTGTSCPTWGPSITAAGGCFQFWFNSMYIGSPGFPKPIRTDGVFDGETLQALITAALIHQTDFPTPFPGTPPTGKKKLSTGAMVGIAAVGATALGGVIYAATHSKKSRRSRRRR